jgi:hypothetical protein
VHTCGYFRLGSPDPAIVPHACRECKQELGSSRTHHQLSGCTDAHNAGVWDIPKDDSAYWPDGDHDKDGVMTCPVPEHHSCELAAECLGVS